VIERAVDDLRWFGKFDLAATVDDGERRCANRTIQCDQGSPPISTLDPDINTQPATSPDSFN
jgi:hypothetical protein